MSKAARKLRDLWTRLDAIYAQLPTINCQGKCAIACGAILLTDAEAHRLQLVTHRKPRTVPGLKALTDFAPDTARQRCIYLTEQNRCSAYDVRPLICRAWGLVRMLSCMHGCVPDRWLKDTEFLRLAQEIERLGGGRLLHTTPAGLVDHGRGFGDVGTPTRSEADIEDHSERVRGLRALHGGRILLADKRIDP